MPVGQLRFLVPESDRLTERAERLGARLKAGLQALQQRYDCIGDVRGRGLLLGLDLVKDRRTKAPDPELAQRVARECLDLGMMTSVVRGGFGIPHRAAPRQRYRRNRPRTGDLRPRTCPGHAPISPGHRARLTVIDLKEAPNCCTRKRFGANALGV